jgi:hypothetical protein
VRPLADRRLELAHHRLRVRDADGDGVELVSEKRVLVRATRAVPLSSGMRAGARHEVRGALHAVLAGVLCPVERRVGGVDER